MILDGLVAIFERSGLTVLDKRYIDIPIWSHTGFYISEVFGSRKFRCI